MANEGLTWEELAAICPKETAAITKFLDKWDIELCRYFHGAACDMDWYEVINIHDFHLPIGEFAEAQNEKKLANQAQKFWEMLKAAYEQATKDGPLCHRIVAVAFENEGAFNEKPYFLTESVPATLIAAELVAQGESSRCEFKSTLRINLHTSADDGRMEHACLKTIAAFLEYAGRLSSHRRQRPWGGFGSRERPVPERGQDASASDQSHQGPNWRGAPRRTPNLRSWATNVSFWSTAGHRKPRHFSKTGTRNGSSFVWDPHLGSCGRARSADTSSKGSTEPIEGDYRGRSAVRVGYSRRGLRLFGRHVRA